MEAFSLLKYWRGTGAVCKSSQTTTTTTTPTIITTASPRSSSSSSDNDEGPYFDLQFALPNENDAAQDTNNGAEELEEEQEINLSISPSSSYDSTKEHLNDHLVPIEPTSLILTSDSTPKFPNILFKSASKFRVLMALKLKKLKENTAAEETKKEGEKGETEKEIQKRKLFTVKLIKVDDVPPSVSLFTRDHSSKSENPKGQEGNCEKVNDEKDEEEKKFAKDMMHKYLKIVKPLYVRASKRYGEKMRLSGQLMTLPASPPLNSTAEVKSGGEVMEVVESVGGSSNNISKSSVKILKEINFTAGLKVVRKQLGKSKSASASAVNMEAQPVSQRRDDSLIQQQDGIQSAIMHCKRSFNASRE